MNTPIIETRTVAPTARKIQLVGITPLSIRTCQRRRPVITTNDSKHSWDRWDGRMYIADKPRMLRENRPRAPISSSQNYFCNVQLKLPNFKRRSRSFSRRVWFLWAHKSRGATGTRPEIQLPRDHKTLEFGYKGDADYAVSSGNLFSFNVRARARKEIEIILRFKPTSRQFGIHPRE